MEYRDKYCRYIKKEDQKDCPKYGGLALASKARKFLERIIRTKT